MTPAESGGVAYDQMQYYGVGLGNGSYLEKSGRDLGEVVPT